MAAAQSLTAICNTTLSPHAHRDGYGHVRGIWDRLYPAKDYAEEIRMLVTHAERQRHSAREANGQNVHNSIRPQESTPRYYAPECFTQISIVPKVQPRNPGDQSRPNSKRVDSMQTSSRSFLQQLQQKHTPRQKCTSAEDLASRKLPPWKMMCARTRRGRAQTQAQAKRRMS